VGTLQRLQSYAVQFDRYDRDLQCDDRTASQSYVRTSSWLMACAPNAVLDAASFLATAIDAGAPL